MTKAEVDAILKRMEIRMAELGMSKEDFYELSGISSASFSQWNTGAHKPTKKKLAQAAKTLDVSLEYLLTGENEKKPVTETNLTDEQQELVKLFDSASPELRAAALAVLRAANGEK